MHICMYMYIFILHYNFPSRLLLTLLHMRELMTLSKFIPHFSSKIQLELSQYPPLPSFPYTHPLHCWISISGMKGRPTVHFKEVSPGTFPADYFNLIFVLMSPLQAVPQGL